MTGAQSRRRPAVDAVRHGGHGEKICRQAGRRANVSVAVARPVRGRLAWSRTVERDTRATAGSSARERSRDDDGRTPADIGRRPRPDRAAARAPCPRSATRLRPVPRPASAACPHRSVHDAAAFALREYDLPAIPTLPAALAGRGDDRPGGRRHRRRHARPVRQHRRRRRPRSTRTAPVVTDLGHDAFGGAAGVPRHRRGPGAARAGQVAVRRTGHARRRADPRRRARPTRPSPSPRAPCAPTSRAIAVAVAAALPDSPQIVWLDEPWFGELMNPGFPIAPDPAIDLLSRRDGGASSRSPPSACTAAPTPTSPRCSPPDPTMLSIPVDARSSPASPATSALPRGRRPDRLGRRADRRADRGEQRAAAGGS